MACFLPTLTMEAFEEEDDNISFACVGVSWMDNEGKRRALLRMRRNDEVGGESDLMSPYFDPD